ncbi:MAG TPA: fructosamine kinase family protein [Puia sp.]
MSHSSDSSSPASLLHSILDRATGRSGFDLPVLYPVGGGSINAAYRITTKDNAQWFSKINDSRAFPDLFEKESRGLDLLRMQDIFRIPAVVAHETARGRQILLLEWIGQGPKTAGFWRLFGEQIAQLHRVIAPSQPARSPVSLHQHEVTPPSEPAGSNALTLQPGSFGLSWDNYMGALPQSNTPSPQWTDFFIQQRLDPQARLAAEKGLLSPAALRSFERLYPSLPGPEEAPSLLHGDLWSGNFICDEHSRPVLIDPAVYFGHRSMDLAMTTLFGGFCNLYPLLIHLNLFGKRPSSGALYPPPRP